MSARFDIVNAFCVDLEEWFHICDISTPYDDPSTWDEAPAHVVEDTEVIMELLNEAGVKATFLTVGWIAEKYPSLIKRISDEGHEIGCHGYYHRLLYTLTPREFEEDLTLSLKTLRRITGQSVSVFRAPGFSMKRECFWAQSILAKFGIKIDISIVPASRDHGGIVGFSRDPLLLNTTNGKIVLFPVSVLKMFGKAIPFSGGGYLRLFPSAIVQYGFLQNHRDRRPCMLYIHPREINPNQPRLKLPITKYVKYYVGINSTKEKLRSLLRAYSFSTVTQTVSILKTLPEYEMIDGDVRAKGE